MYESLWYFILSYVFGFFFVQIELSSVSDNSIEL